MTFFKRAARVKPDIALKSACSLKETMTVIGSSAGVFSTINRNSVDSISPTGEGVALKDGLASAGEVSWISENNNESKRR